MIFNPNLTKVHTCKLYLCIGETWENLPFLLNLVKTIKKQQTKNNTEQQTPKKFKSHTFSRLVLHILKMLHK